MREGGCNACDIESNQPRKHWEEGKTYTKATAIVLAVLLLSCQKTSTGREEASAVGKKKQALGGMKKPPQKATVIILSCMLPG